MKPRVQPLSAPPEALRWPTREEWLATGGRVASASAAMVLLPGCGVLWTMVAPVFQHGAGRASFGCKAVASPVYLSEEDAAEVVREELEAAGFTGVRTDCPAWHADRRVMHDTCGSITRVEILEGMTVTDPFDVCVPGENLAIEVVTTGDDLAVSGESLGGLCSVGAGPQTRGTAQYLSAEISATLVIGASYAGILYDPLSLDSGMWWETGTDSEEAALDHSRAQLRAQMQDFLAWLDDRRWR